MKDETLAWLDYANENLAVAELCLGHGHLNACLYNTQQAVEKFLKAWMVEQDLPFRKTHAVLALWQSLMDYGLKTTLTEEECALLDSVFMPSCYPLFSILPDSAPDRALCEACLRIARRVKDSLPPSHR